MAHLHLVLSVCGVHQASNLHRSYLHILSKTYRTFIGISCEFAGCTHNSANIATHLTKNAGRTPEDT